MERLVDAGAFTVHLRKGEKMRLIDADELKTAFPCGESVRTESVRATIDHMATVDAEPVRHGRWIMPNKEKTDRPLPECSHCGWYVDKGGVLDFTYCPNCGAKMEEVSK